MGFTFFQAGRLLGCVLVSGAVAAYGTVGAAQTRSQSGLDKGQYIPNIWVDPDGCEHWVMDDGAEGFMTPHVTRDGIPVCREGNVCAVMKSDQFFATDSFNISEAGRTSLAEFFRTEKSRSFVVIGHTDSSASDAYNMQLSKNRANAVAEIGRAQGAVVSDIRGLGERQPIASNATAEGKARNRRVEILCVR